MQVEASSTAPPAAAPRRHVRLVIALAVAALLGTFAVYTAFAGQGKPVISVGGLPYHEGDIRLMGHVVAFAGDAGSPEGMRITMRDMQGPETVEVVYHGSVPDAFRAGREVVVDGTATAAGFTSDRGSLTTKCPSKYTEKPQEA